MIRLPLATALLLPLATFVLAAAQAEESADPATESATAATAPKRKQFFPEDRAKWLKAVTGTFDMTKSPRPYVAVLILDQEGNRLPSFWCGKNQAGTIVWTHEISTLDWTVDLRHKGGFTVQMTHVPRKWGLVDDVPGGAWIADMAKQEVKVAIEAIKGLELVDVREGSLFAEAKMSGSGTMRAGLLVELHGACSGRVMVGEKSVPFASTRCKVLFLNELPCFRIEATFPLDGQGLGLSGPAGKGITATVMTATLASKTNEAPKEVKADLPFDP